MKKIAKNIHNLFRVGWLEGEKSIPSRHNKNEWISQHFPN